MKDYDQYCPIAHSLGLVGERWTLLVVRELYYGPKRYTDLVDNLPGIGTNILATRLKELEANGLIEKRRLPPPAASMVYELTDNGRLLQPVLHELARFGARLIGPPPAHALTEGWLLHALDLGLAPVSPQGRIAFRIGNEEASLVDGQVTPGVVYRTTSWRSRRRQLLLPDGRWAPRRCSARRRSCDPRPVGPRVRLEAARPHGRLST